VFCGAEKEQLKHLRVIFILFEAISGLHINWGKSFVYPVNEGPDINSLASILGGKVGELPTTYLGMPLGAKSKSKNIWNAVVEKCEKKLANRRSQYLSLGGRLTLINSVLDAMPTYMMSLFPLPGCVLKKLDSIWRNILWQGNGEGGKEASLGEMGCCHQQQKMRRNGYKAPQSTEPESSLEVAMEVCLWRTEFVERSYSFQIYNGRPMDN